MKRRRFLQWLLQAASFLPLGSFHVRADGSPTDQVPLSQLGAPWSFAEVEFTKEISTNRGPRPSTFPGYIIRLPEDVAERLTVENGLYAVSRICPHEGCPINFYHKRAEVPYAVEIKEFANPMLVCTCHQSVFDPAQGGKVLSGPAPHRPWIFELTVEKGSVMIKDLEPGGEKWG